MFGGGSVLASADGVHIRYVARPSERGEGWRQREAVRDSSEESTTEAVSPSLLTKMLNVLKKKNIIMPAQQRSF